MLKKPASYIDGIHVYVYELVDPRDGKVFYVGCGSGTRVRTSGTIACSVQQPAKYAVVKAIRDAGLKPETRIVSEHLSKDEALVAEADHHERLTLVRGLVLTNKQKWAPVPKEERQDFSAYEVVDPIVDKVFHVGCNYTARVVVGIVLIEQLRGWKAELIAAIRKAGAEPLVRSVQDFKSFPEAIRARNSHRASLVAEKTILTKETAPTHRSAQAKAKSVATRAKSLNRLHASAWCGERSGSACRFLPAFFGADAEYYPVAPCT